MTPLEQVAFAWKHRDHFEAVHRHNLDLVIQRRRGDRSVAPDTIARRGIQVLVVQENAA